MTRRTCAASLCRERESMTCSGRGKRLSGRPSVGGQSAGGRGREIIARAETARPDGKAVGQPQKTQFRGCYLTTS
ncbi:hypothetical protein [Xenorhabdus cabanillasii]|uniref:hypothetical protein n=1 Tax=Xenorhabdus cabanillasii TaxID=351673 RepID=UPI001145270C|nr:hypothetical protein [Xenorhabdus cabanillasii]